MWLYILALVAGLSLLTWAADQFIKGAASTSVHLGIPQLLVGVIVIGFGTSAPEMLVSGMAAYQGSLSIGIGNALGSNITNSTLILGATALICPLAVSSSILRREIPVLYLCAGVCFYLLSDVELSFSDGAVLLLLMLASMTFLARNSRAASDDKTADPYTSEAIDDLPDMPLGRSVFWLVVGLLALVGSSKVIVWGAVGVATAFGISELVIGLTIVAIGTSLPELAATVAGALRNQHDLALGNIIGSNIFNLLAVIGICGLAGPGTFDDDALYRDYAVMAATFLVLLPMMLSRSGQSKISRAEGAFLLAVFVGYMAWLFMNQVL